MGKSTPSADGFGKGILSMPQIRYIEELLANLKNPNNMPYSNQDLQKLQADKVAFDFIVENQRGTTLFGIALFSHKSLLTPFDPPNFQTLHGTPIFDLRLYPLPDFHWKWSWDSWSILMMGDVDEDGFVYSHFNFNSKKWKGVYKFGHFIRRRLWVRKREKISSTELFEVFRVPRDFGTTSQANDLRKDSRNLSVVTNTNSLYSSPSQVEGAQVRKMKTREKLKNKMRRKKKAVDEGEQIEFINDDTSFLPSIYPSEVESVNSYIIEDDSVDDGVTVEQRVNLLRHEVEGSKLDREKIEKIVRFVTSCTPQELSEISAVLANGSEPYLTRILNSFDHFSSKEILVRKLESVASSESEPVMLTGVREVTQLISQYI